MKIDRPEIQAAEFLGFSRLEIAARRGGGKRQMHRPLFDRAFRASLIHTLKAVWKSNSVSVKLSVKMPAQGVKSSEK
jgi:hypothetical protein